MFVFKIQRLPTRDIREKLKIVRKRLWLIEIFSEKYVLFWVSRKYAEIYKRHFVASVKASSMGLYAPKHLVKIPSLRLSILSWQGKNVLMDFSNMSNEQKTQIIYNILDWLKNFNSFSSRKASIHKFRYIELFLEKNKELSLSGYLISELKRVIDRVNENKNFVVGLGIEDVVLSNFTQLNDKVCLVDLDNFSESINFYYEIGFLMADLEIDHEFSLEQTQKLYTDYLKSRQLQQKFSIKIFTLGRISRYTITALNVQTNKNYSYKMSLNEALQRITQELDSDVN